MSDAIVEENEYFNITLASSDSIVLIEGPTTIIITDDDGKTKLHFFEEEK